jgi:hypothetical protein
VYHYYSWHAHKSLLLFIQIGQDASNQLQQDVVETGAEVKQEAEQTGRR